MAAPPSEEHVTWKSHIGLAISTDRRTLRATAKGWGRSGALTDALLTRQGTLEGFLTALPQPNASLFIGLTNLSGSLYDHSRAHQEDLDFALRVSSSGELSYTSKSRMMQYAYSPHLESDTVCTVEKGDVVGMRLTPDRRGLQIIREVVEEAPSGGTASAAAAATSSSSSDAAAAATVATAAAPVSEPSPVASPPPASPEVRILVLKTFPEVLSFPFKIMAVFGGANYQVVLPLSPPQPLRKPFPRFSQATCSHGPATPPTDPPVCSAGALSRPPTTLPNSTMHPLHARRTRWGRYGGCAARTRARTRRQGSRGRTRWTTSRRRRRRRPIIGQSGHFGPARVPQNGRVCHACAKLPTGFAA